MMRMRLRAPDEPEAEATSPVSGARDASTDDSVGASGGGGGGDGFASGYSTPERSLPHLDVHSPDYIEERLENLKRRPTWVEYLDQYVQEHPDSEDEDDTDVELRWNAQTPGLLRSTLWSLLLIALSPLLLVSYPCLRHKGPGFWPLGCRSLGELLAYAAGNVLAIAAGLTLVYWTICRELPDLFNMSNTRINVDTRVHDIQRSAGTCNSALLQWERSVAQELCMPLGIDGVLLLLNAWLVLHAHRRWARYVMALMAVLFVVDLPTRLYDATFPAPEILRVDPSFAMVDEELLVALEGKNLKPGGSVAWVAYWGCATTTDVDSCEKQYPATFEAGVVSVTFRALDHFIPCYRDPPNPLKLQEYWCSENVRIRVKDKQSIPGWSKTASRPVKVADSTVEMEEKPANNGVKRGRLGVVEAAEVKVSAVTTRTRKEERVASTTELERELVAAIPEVLEELNVSEPELHEELVVVVVEDGDESAEDSSAKLQEHGSTSASSGDKPEAAADKHTEELELSSVKLQEKEPVASTDDEGESTASLVEDEELTASGSNENEVATATGEEEEEEAVVIADDEEESLVSMDEDGAPVVVAVDEEKPVDNVPEGKAVDVSIPKLHEELVESVVVEEEPTASVIDGEDLTGSVIQEDQQQVSVTKMQEDQTVVDTDEDEPVVIIVDDQGSVIAVSDEVETVIAAADDDELADYEEAVVPVVDDEAAVLAVVKEEELGIYEEEVAIAVTDQGVPAVAAPEEGEPAVVVDEEDAPVVAVIKDEEPVVVAVMGEDTELAVGKSKEDSVDSITDDEEEEGASGKSHGETVAIEEHTARTSKKEPINPEDKQGERPESWLSQHWTTDSSATEESERNEVAQRSRDEQLVLNVVKREQEKLKAVKALQEQVARKKRLLEEAALGLEKSELPASAMENAKDHERAQAERSSRTETRNTPSRTTDAQADENPKQPTESTGQGATLTNSKPRAKHSISKEKPAQDDTKAEVVEKKRTSSKKTKKIKKTKRTTQGSSDKRTVETVAVDAQGNVATP